MPTARVNWDDARQFCKWLGETDGRTYRLPTLAEALWAARAGNAGVAPGATVKVNDDDDDGLAPHRFAAAERTRVPRETAVTRFCTDHIIPRYETYYEEVCARAC